MLALYNKYRLQDKFEVRQGRTRSILIEFGGHKIKTNTNVYYFEIP